MVVVVVVNVEGWGQFGNHSPFTDDEGFSVRRMGSCCRKVYVIVIIYGSTGSSISSANDFL